MITKDAAKANADAAWAKYKTAISAHADAERRCAYAEGEEFDKIFAEIERTSIAAYDASIIFANANAAAEAA